MLDEAVLFASYAAKKTGKWRLTPNGNVVASTIAGAAAEDRLRTLTFDQRTTAAGFAVRTFRSLLPKRRVSPT